MAACKPFGDIHSICPWANTPILVLLYNIAVFLTILAVCLSIKARVIVFMLLKVVNNVEKRVK